MSLWLDGDAVNASSESGQFQVSAVVEVAANESFPLSGAAVFGSELPQELRSVDTISGRRNFIQLVCVPKLMNASMIFHVLLEPGVTDHAFVD